MRFEFPVVTYYGDEPDDFNITRHDAVLIPGEIYHEPYEALLYAFDDRFELIVDRCKKGMYLCIPNKGFGCYIDTPWGCDNNHVVILEASDLLSFDDATAISFALDELYKLVTEHKCK